MSYVAESTSPAVSGASNVVSLAAGALVLVERAMEELWHELGVASAPRLTAMLDEHAATGGKRLRARLALRAGHRAGLQPRAAVLWAAVCELLHNASLVHDDIQDGDTVRRGEPTLWSRWGADQALLAGDALLMLPWIAVARMPIDAELRVRVVECVARRAFATAAGQSTELFQRAELDLSRATWTSAAAGKTGQFFALPVEGALLAAGVDARTAQAVGGAFEALGVAYQQLDDVVDLYGDKGRGARGCDILEGKVSALVVAHVEQHPGDVSWLRPILARERDATTDGDIERVRQAFDASGAAHRVIDDVARTRARIHRILADASLGDLAQMADDILARAAVDLDRNLAALVFSSTGPSYDAGAYPERI